MTWVAKNEDNNYWCRNQTWKDDLHSAVFYDSKELKPGDKWRMMLTGKIVTKWMSVKEAMVWEVVEK